MYHNQGEMATRLLGFERGVTLQVGVPVPVVTPRALSAFDLAGKGIAKAGNSRGLSSRCEACTGSQVKWFHDGYGVGSPR